MFPKFNRDCKLDLEHTFLDRYFSNLDKKSDKKNLIPLRRALYLKDQFYKIRFVYFEMPHEHN